MSTSRASERRLGAMPLGRRLLRLASLLPALVMCTGFAVLAHYCHTLLVDAAAGRPVVVGAAGFWFAIFGFFAACVVVVVMQSVRIAHRVGGPEWRLRRAMQRIRGGDLAFRVSLRRGDLLTGLAHECNELLDWLNRNPPAGTATGSDVVELERGRAPRGSGAEVGS